MSTEDILCPHSHEVAPHTMTAVNQLSTNQTASDESISPDRSFLNDLNRFQRILMVTDGTVTELLEQYAAETIKVRKLFEKVETSFDELITHHQQYLDPSSLPVLKRAILLQGQTTKTNWLYAESSILLDNLHPGFRADLLASREPIGRLWEKYRYETFKTILNYQKRPAGELAVYFELPEDSTMIARTYRVYSGNKPIMIITEMFPDSLFQQ